MISTTQLLVVDVGNGDLAVLNNLLADDRTHTFELTSIDGDDAADLIRSTTVPFDAILVGRRDVHSSATRLVKRLRSVADEQPILMCSEFFDDRSDAEMAAAGIDAMLPKTVWSAETLVNTIGFSIEVAKQRHQQRRDPLTGLPNRAVWSDRLHHAIERSRRSGLSYAVLAIDVDDFKSVNDALGHDGGDVYLKEIAARLRSTVRNEDTVARSGGDEFSVLIENLAHPELAVQVAEKLITEISTPITIERSIIPVTISVGVSVAGGTGRELSGEWVEKSADAALYRAKQGGKNRLTLFTDDLDAELLAAFELDEQVAHAVRHNDFTLHYQPIIDLGRGRLDGFEALLRWETGPGHGESPGKFVPILERLGLMDAVGRTVFTEAISQLGRWRRASGEALSMHVNLSASQIVDADLTTFLLDALEAQRVPPEALVIELTESMLFEHQVALDRAFAELRTAGIRFSIDDFGTGYNSLVNLKRFRPDQIKIDGEFIDQIADSPVDMAIVRAQAILAASLGMSIVAECVESDHQLLALRDVATTLLAQGYHFGRPMSTVEIEQSFHPFRRLIDTDQSTLRNRALPLRRPAARPAERAVS
ncbi:MAG: putative bifunctional diguanylate cyclase/phosphodiesterase [Ilumatobacter sp.]